MTRAWIQADLDDPSCTYSVKAGSLRLVSLIKEITMDAFDSVQRSSQVFSWYDCLYMAFKSPWGLHQGSYSPGRVTKLDWQMLEATITVYHLALSKGWAYGQPTPPPPICKNKPLLNRRVGGGVRGVRTNPLWRSIMAEEKLLNKVPVVEIHQPKKNRDVNPFFRPYVLSSVKIKIVKNPWRLILMTFHFCGKTASTRKSHRKACFAIRFVLWMRFTSNLIVQALLSFTRNYVQVRLRIHLWMWTFHKVYYVTE